MLANLRGDGRKGREGGREEEAQTKLGRGGEGGRRREREREREREGGGGGQRHIIHKSLPSCLHALR